jgi:trk system potassium uptake protein TrkA
MNIFVVGCGRVGAELAYRLYEKGHTVTVIDIEPTAFENLHPDFRGRTILGEVLNENFLRQAGMDQADGVAAVTSSDSVNAVLGHIARTIFNVPNIIVRNYDPERRPLIEAFELQIVASSSWGAQRIEELLDHPELRTVFSAGNGEIEIYEFTSPQAWSGRRIEELPCQEDCSLVAITRAGQALLPAQDTTLQEGDILLVSATDRGITGLRRRLLDLQET